jgi:hypothetical protein
MAWFDNGYIQETSQLYYVTLIYDHGIKGMRQCFINRAFIYRTSAQQYLDYMRTQVVPTLSSVDGTECKTYRYTAEYVDTRNKGLCTLYFSLLCWFLIYLFNNRPDIIRVSNVLKFLNYLFSFVQLFCILIIVNLVSYYGIADSKESTLEL